MKRLGMAARAALIGGLAISGVSFVAAPANAGTAGSDITVSATVSANCTISAGALAFGAYDPVSANASSPKDGTATLTVTCTSGSTGNITLDQGDNANTGSTDAVPLRRMINGSNHLAYYLYQDSERTTVWGNTTATDVAHLGTGSSASVTVYGQIPGGQNVPAAAYTDTVTATITF